MDKGYTIKEYQNSGQRGDRDWTEAEQRQSRALAESSECFMIVGTIETIETILSIAPPLPPSPLPSLAQHKQALL
jgi:hypothetical protein